MSRGRGAKWGDCSVYDCITDISSLQDSELIALSRAKCEYSASAAFTELWQRHYRLAVSLLRPLVQSDAEDIASEAFATVWTQLRDGGGPEAHFKAYVVCVAKRLAYRQYRKNRVFTAGISDEDLATGATHDPTLGVEARDQIAAAFNAIPERWVEVLWMQAVEGKTRPELCQALGLSPNATSALTRRARNGFRRAFELAEA